MMKKLILLLAVPFLSCTTEPAGGEPAPPKTDGYLQFKLHYADFKTDKADVPECSALSPNTIRVVVLQDGRFITRTAPIEINGDHVESTEPMIFNEGNYTIEEISLLRDGLVTHTAPHELDPRFNFAAFVDNPLPYDITIEANAITQSSNEVMCFTEDPIDIDPGFIEDPEYFWSGGLVDMITVYFQIPSTTCINIIVIEVEREGEIRSVTYPITRSGLHAIPVPADFDGLSLSAFEDNYDVLIWAYNLEEYNEDGVLNELDIRTFPPYCD